MKNFFYIKDFCYIKDENALDVSFVPPLVRRKLSLLDKTVLMLADKMFNPNIEEIVFSSEYGEFTRLDTIISQYQEADEVSPSQFSASVYNYPVSFFTLYKKLNIPYHAISSGENSLAAGFFKSIISPIEEVLFVYADIKNKVHGAACVISKTYGNMKFEYDNSQTGQTGFEEFIEFLDGKRNSLNSPFGSFKTGSCN